MRDAEAVTFARGALDRAAHLRARRPTLAADPRALCLALWQGKPLIEPGPPPRLAWLPMTAPVFAAAGDAPVFLGVADGAPRFAREHPRLGRRRHRPPPLLRRQPRRPPGAAAGPRLRRPARGDGRALRRRRRHRRRRQGHPRLARDPPLLRPLRRAPPASPTRAGSAPAPPAAPSTSRAPTPWSSC